MAIKIIWSEPARNDVDDIFYNLSEVSERYATGWVERVFHDLELLELFPEMGRVVPEKEISFLREIIVWKYRVLYSFLNNEITVIRIQHSTKPLGKV